MKVEQENMDVGTVYREKSTQPRLDLNDLLERSKLREKENRRTNAITVGVTLVVVFIFGIYIVL